MTPSQTANQKNADTTRDQQQGAAVADAAQVRSNNANLNGAITDTGYYKNQVKAGAGSTTGAYDASRRNLKQSMEAAGVTGDSGVSAGNNTALSAQEASDLGKVKTNAYTDTENQQLKANQQGIDLTGIETGAGEKYADIGNTDENQRQAQGNANKIALAKAIATAAAGA